LATGLPSTAGSFLAGGIFGKDGSGLRLSKSLSGTWRLRNPANAMNAEANYERCSKHLVQYALMTLN